MRGAQSHFSPRLVESMRLRLDAGWVVTDVRLESPADRGGLRVGDVLLELNESEIGNRRHLAKELAETRERGRSLVFLVQRGTTTTYVEVDPE